MPSPAAESTLQVVAEATPQLASRFMFVYGHAPRSSDHYSTLVKVSARTVVTRTPWSSKRKLIPAKGHGYIEPPYVVRADDFLGTRGMGWADFFAEARG